MLPSDAFLDLATASGFVRRGEWLEALVALQRLPEAARLSKDALVLQVIIFKGLQVWDRMEAAAERLVAEAPQESLWCVAWACAKRHAGNGDGADEVVEMALTGPHLDGTLAYHLALYACTLGDIVTANKFLVRALNLCPELRLVALDDEALRPLWDSL